MGTQNQQSFTTPDCALTQSGERKRSRGKSPSAQVGTREASLSSGQYIEAHVLALVYTAEKLLDRQKPSPEGLAKLLARWGLKVSERKAAVLIRRVIYGARKIQTYELPPIQPDPQKRQGLDRYRSFYVQIALVAFRNETGIPYPAEAPEPLKGKCLQVWSSILESLNGTHSWIKAVEAIASDPRLFTAAREALSMAEGKVKVVLTQNKDLYYDEPKYGQEVYVPVPKLAKYLEVSKEIVFRWAREGLIPAVRLGDRILVKWQT